MYESNYSNNYQTGENASADNSKLNEYNSVSSDSSYNSYSYEQQQPNYQFLKQTPLSYNTNPNEYMTNYYNYYQYNQYYPYNQYESSFYNYAPNTNYSFQSASKSPNPYSYVQDDNRLPVTNDRTPEKPVMNDSGIDSISPTLQSFAQISVPSNSTPVLPQQSTNSSEQTKIQSAVKNNDSATVEDDADQSIETEDEEEDTDEAMKEKSTTDKKKNSKNNEDASKPPKPYLEIIADAILSRNVKMMQLHEIYNFMENKYCYFAKNVNKSWRNSVRHNLSLNECFVKAGRGSNGKGNYWKIHPLCEKEFIRGNFRRKTFKQLIKAGRMTQQQAYNNQPVHLAGYLPYTDYTNNYSSNIIPQFHNMNNFSASNN